jgi:23S rRNA pseudouridine2605 synthase
VDKTYLVWVTGAPADAAEQLARPMELDGYRLQPAKVREVTRTPAYALLEMTIHEGRNRQIRRMCEQCGMTVTRLRRISEGPLQLGKLETGKWRYLTEKEQKMLGVL